MIWGKTFWAGLLLLVVSLLTPSRFLIQPLRDFPADPVLAEQLLQGAHLFRFGLGILGLMLIAFSAPVTRQRLGLEDQPPAVRGEKDPYILPLIGLLILSVALRLYKLGEGLWLDEIGMWFKYLRRPFGELLTTYDSENQHLLYTILAHICTAFWGDTGWAMRFPAMIFGVAGIWALYLFGKEVTSRLEAFLASVLLSLSYYDIWFSQNARGYSGLLFWTIFSSWLFVRAISHQSSSRLWIAYAATVAMGAYTQLVMVFVATGHFAIYLYRLFFVKSVGAGLRPARASQTQRPWNGLLLGFVLAGVFTFQLYAVVLPQFLTAIGMKGTVAAWNSPLWTLMEIVRGLKVSFAGGFAATAALVLFVAGLWSYARSKPILVALLILPPLLGASVVLALGHPLWPRFFFFAFGFGALVVVRGGMLTGAVISKGLEKIGVQIHSRKAGVLFCCCLIVISALSIPLAYLPKQDFIGARSFVDGSRKPGDAVVTVGRIALPYSTYYQTDFIEVKSVETLNDVRAKAGRTWLLYMIPADVEFVYPQLMANIRQHFRVVKTFSSPLADGVIFVCIDNSQ